MYRVCDTSLIYAVASECGRVWVHVRRVCGAYAWWSRFVRECVRACARQRAGVFRRGGGAVHPLFAADIIDGSFREMTLLPPAHAFEASTWGVAPPEPELVGLDPPTIKARS